MSGKKLTIGLLVVLGLFAESSRAAVVVWTDTSLGKVFSGNTVTGTVDEVVSGLSNPWGIAVDTANQHIYIANAGTRQIMRCSVDGSGLVPLANTVENLCDIELDLVNQKMYWAACPGIVGYTDYLYRANLDGTNVQSLTPNRWNPLGLALDVPNGKMYWSEFNYTRYEMRIQRANLDGTSIEHVLWTGGVFARDIDIDLTHGKLYWTDYGNDTVRRANLDGSSVEIVVSRPGIGVGIKVDPSVDKLYVGVDNGLLEASLDGSNQRMVFSGVAPQHIALLAPTVPEPTTLAIWATLGALGLIAGRHRRRTGAVRRAPPAVDGRDT